MTQWYEPKIIAVQDNKSGRWRDWSGASMTVDEAKKGERNGTHIMCQKREAERTLLLAWRRNQAAKQEPVGNMRAGYVR